jgi:serine/threonine protein kinase
VTDLEHEVARLIGKIIDGRYKILDFIGQGGSASVYRALQITLDRVVALKILNPFPDNESRKLFESEARAMAKLNHPNLLAVFDSGVTEGSTYLAMEFIDGLSLKSLLADGRPLASGEVLKVAQQAGSALTYAHQKGIVHRDLNPSNILISAKDGRVVVSDFGLVLESEDTGLTQAGLIVGTPAYMSPEQIRAERLNPATDIYSLGIVLYEALTGRRPFLFSDLDDLLLKTLREPPPPPRNFNPALPPAIDRVLLKALAKSREERYPTMEDFVAAFVGALELTGPAPPIVSVDEFFNFLMDKVFLTLKPDRGVVLLRSRVTNELIPAVVRVAEGISADDIRLSKTLVAQVVEKRNGILLMDTSTYSGSDAPSVRLSGIKSVLAVPLENDGEVIGLIYLDSQVGHRSFEDEDLRLLTSLANTATARFQNLRRMAEAVADPRTELTEVDSGTRPAEPAGDFTERSPGAPPAEQAADLTERGGGALSAEPAANLTEGADQASLLAEPRLPRKSRAEVTATIARRTFFSEESTPVAWIYIVSGPLRGRQFQLKDIVTIGRSPECDIILDDTGVSRLHAMIQLTRDRYSLQDNHTTNGTFVNTERIEIRELRDRDEVRVGNTILRFILAVGPEEQTADAKRRLQEFDEVWKQLATSVMDNG